jgi:hypothetical protein
MSRADDSTSLESVVYKNLQFEIEKFTAPVKIPREYIEDPSEADASRARAAFFKKDSLPDDDLTDKDSVFVNVAGKDNQFEEEYTVPGASGDGLYVASYDHYVWYLARFWISAGKPRNLVPAFEGFFETYDGDLSDEEIDEFNKFLAERRIYIVAEANSINKHISYIKRREIIRSAATPLRALTIEMIEDAAFLLRIATCFRAIKVPFRDARSRAAQLKSFVDECAALEDYIEEFVTTRIKMQAEQSFLERQRAQAAP